MLMRANPQFLATVVEDLLKQFCDAKHPVTVILVSHGDTLQILETVWRGMDPREHRSLPSLPTSTPRYMPSEFLGRD